MVYEIKNQLYKINTYGAGNPIYVEASTKGELFEYVANRVIQGDIIVSVVAVYPDGTTPKIPVLTDKNYKAIYKELVRKAKNKETMLSLDFKSKQAKDAFVKSIWEEFGDIPIDSAENILEDFYLWPKDTYRIDIWHWFDENYSGGVAGLLMEC